MAGGMGLRLGGDRPKAFALLGGQALLTHALEGALAAPEIGHVVVVVPPAHRAHAEELISQWVAARQAGDAAALVEATAAPARGADAAAVEEPPVAARCGPGGAEAVPVQVVPGGKDRSASVRAGLRALDPCLDLVLVHDAARPLTPPTLFSAVVAAVRSGLPAVVPGVPVTDTVKQIDGQGRVTATPNRAQLRGIQTPQGFRRDVLERAHASGHTDVTDDAGLVEALGEPVVVIEGHPLALKITTAPDLKLAEALLPEAQRLRPEPRVPAGAGAPRA